MARRWRRFIRLVFGCPICDSRRGLHKPFCQLR